MHDFIKFFKSIRLNHLNPLRKQSNNMSAYKNVVLAGATGSLGSRIFEKLVAAGKFNITLLRRQGSTSTLPSGYNAIDVDYESVESLTAALKGQDVVISAAGSFSIASQKALIEASLAAGVKRYIPSDFGSDLDVPQTRILPVYTSKIEMQDYLIEKSKTTDITYTFIYNGAFLDWGLEHGFLLKVKDNKPSLINGGDAVFSTTTLDSVGDAVVGVLSHPEETKNRTVRVESIKLTQLRLLELAKQAVPEKSWEPENLNLADAVAASDKQRAEGNIGPFTFIPYLWQAVLQPGYGGSFKETDNKLLGIKPTTEADVIEILKAVLK